MKIVKNTLLATLLLLIVSISYMSFNYKIDKNDLGVYNPANVNPQLVDSSLQHIKKGHTIADFELINQNGTIITQKDYEDKIYVADFFFSSCPTICPVMTTNMAKIQKEFINDNDIMLLSLSVTPATDSIPKLREYTDKNGVIDSKWNVTTGNKKHIYELARKSFFAATDKGDGGPDDFIHTSNFVLIDKDKQIRGIYDGIKTDEVLRLINDIKILQKIQ